MIWSGGGVSSNLPLFGGGTYTGVSRVLFSVWLTLVDAEDFLCSSKNFLNLFIQISDIMNILRWNWSQRGSGYQLLHVLITGCDGLIGKGWSGRLGASLRGLLGGGEQLGCPVGATAGNSGWQLLGCGGVRASEDGAAAGREEEEERKKIRDKP